MDTFNAVVQALNAAGIPLLVVGMVLLVLAYQRATQAYREGSAHLRDENDRLRKRLSEMDGQYFAVVDRVVKLLAKTEKAVDELEARKIGLMASSADASNTDEVLAEVRKINVAIADLRDLPVRIQMHLKYELDDARSRLAELAEKVGDNPTRLAIASILLPSEAYDKLAEELKKYPRGIVMRSEDDKAKRFESPSTPSLLNTGPSEAEAEPEEQ